MTGIIRPLSIVVTVTANEDTKEDFDLELFKSAVDRWFGDKLPPFMRIGQGWDEEYRRTVRYQFTISAAMLP